MGRAFGLALGIMLAACAALAQTDNNPWRMQAPLPTGDDLRGVAMVSTTEAWAVGAGGTILHTNDGGRVVDTSGAPRAD